MTIFFELPVLDKTLKNSSLLFHPNKNEEMTLELSSLPTPAKGEYKPEWLKIRPPKGEAVTRIQHLLRSNHLNTVCEEAHCPNLAECWLTGTATLMIGGKICTRSCHFCAIQTARRPPALDPNEPFQVAKSIVALGLRYVVLTSVDRDDLPEGGAHHFASTIREIKRLNPSIVIEALVPDFRGNPEAIQMIVESKLDVYAHNIETIERLQSTVRDPRAHYEQSLLTLRTAKIIAKKLAHPLFTKSSIMLGLGEKSEELEQTFRDLRTNEIDFLTLGQYLRPSPQHLPVKRYLFPSEFETLGKIAENYGFLYVASGPMIRSSYRAGEFFIKNIIKKRRANDAI